MFVVLVLQDSVSLFKKDVLTSAIDSLEGRDGTKAENIGLDISCLS